MAEFRAVRRMCFHVQFSLSGAYSAPHRRTLYAVSVECSVRGGSTPCGDGRYRAAWNVRVTEVQNSVHKDGFSTIVARSRRDVWALEAILYDVGGCAPHRSRHSNGSGGPFTLHSRRTRKTQAESNLAHEGRDVQRADAQRVWPHSAISTATAPSWTRMAGRSQVAAWVHPTRRRVTEASSSATPSRNTRRAAL